MGVAELDDFLRTLYRACVPCTFFAYPIPAPDTGPGAYPAPYAPPTGAKGAPVFLRTLYLSRVPYTFSAYPIPAPEAPSGPGAATAVQVRIAPVHYRDAAFSRKRGSRKIKSTTGRKQITFQVVILNHSTEQSKQNTNTTKKKPDTSTIHAPIEFPTLKIVKTAKIDLKKKIVKKKNCNFQFLNISTHFPIYTILPFWEAQNLRTLYLFRVPSTPPLVTLYCFCVPYTQPFFAYPLPPRFCVPLTYSLPQPSFSEYSIFLRTLYLHSCVPSTRFLSTLYPRFQTISFFAYPLPAFFLRTLYPDSCLPYTHFCVPYTRISKRPSPFSRTLYPIYFFAYP